MGENKNRWTTAVTDFVVLGFVALAGTMFCRNAGFEVYAGILCGLSILFFILVLCLRLRKQYNLEVAKKEAKAELSAPLALDYIHMRMKEYNFECEVNEEDGCLYFKAYGQAYILRLSGTTMFLMCRIGLDKTSVNFDDLLNAVYAADRSLLSAKIYVHDVEDDNQIYVDVVCQFFIGTRYAFDCSFLEYLNYMSRAADMANDAINKSSVKDSNGESDGDKPRQEIYQLEYSWLPSLVEAVAKGQTPIEALTDEDWMQECFKRRCESVGGSIDSTSFKIKRVDNYGDYKMIVYQFPEPKVTPEAKYGIVLLNKLSLETSYYTLEKSFNDEWYYCGVADNRHLNYGLAESEELDKFIEWVLSNSKSAVASIDFNKG